MRRHEVEAALLRRHGHGGHVVLLQGVALVGEAVQRGEVLVGNEEGAHLHLLRDELAGRVGIAIVVLMSLADFKVRRIDSVRELYKM